ncbi:TPA: hypothetical protein ACGUM0_004226 [Vibrio vulnificus]|uniref:hypothetical protein n=1 Tax=Vibrio vulnificus TaxID=672 RepID=UPI0019D47994|nr:hypothetical protein [Vibrio vulnificus]MBN8091148.1 hypothetical protein [Vibrio vulnificus]MBN8120010.1 hypothetical protein [Vibrio vulnificus]
MKQFLYRGVSMGMHKKDDGKLIPKGNNIEVVMTRSDHNPQEGVELLRDGRFLRGPSEINTLRAHQMKSGMHERAFLSTSVSLNVAMMFATTNGTEPGVVYKIDPDLFEQFGVVARQDPDPKYANEAEVSIRSVNGGEIPSEVVVDVIEIPVASA